MSFIKTENDMRPVERIVLASTLTANTDRALDRACMIAKSAGAQLCVVHSIDPGILPERAVFAAMERTKTALEQELADSPACDGLGPEIDVLLGTPDDAVCEFASDKRADLLVVGSSRNAALGGTVWGTAVEHIVRKSSCPVLVVKRRPNRAYRDLLVALDLQDPSLHALEFALRVFPSARMTVIHADEDAQEWNPGTREIEKRVGDAVAARCAAAGYPPPGTDGGPVVVVLPESPASGLHRAIAAREPDLAVLGTHGRSGLANLFIGSIAEELLERLSCDVLVARAPAAAGQGEAT
jgi:nucleotide-binding universal stress UspA family protein